ALGLLGKPIKLIQASPEAVIIETEDILRVENMQRRLGGIVKILQVVDEVPKRPQDSINFALKHYFKPSVLKKQFLKEYKGKIQFDISIYVLDMDLAKPPMRDQSREKIPAPSAFGEPKRIGMMIKNVLTEAG